MQAVRPATMLRADAEEPGSSLQRSILRSRRVLREALVEA